MSTRYLLSVDNHFRSTRQHEQHLRDHHMATSLSDTARFPLPGTHFQNLLLIGASVLRLRDAFSDGRDLGGDGVRVHGRDVESLQRRRKDGHGEEDVENLGELHFDCRRKAAGKTCERWEEMTAENKQMQERWKQEDQTLLTTLQRDGKLRWRTEVVFHVVHVSGASSILMGEPLPLPQPKKDAVTTGRTCAVRSPSQALPTKIGRSVSESCPATSAHHSPPRIPSSCNPRRVPAVPAVVSAV